MNKRNTIRDGLTRWNLEQARRLYAHLLQRPCPGSGRVEQHLNAMYQLNGLSHFIELITVSSTPSGRSRFRYMKSKPSIPIELEINHGNLARFYGGGTYEEYQRYADDPVIGSRAVNNAEEALVMKIGHELAHLIVALSPTFADAAPKPHGAEFQAVYREIRSCAVNPWLDESAPNQDDKHSQRLIRKLNRLRAMAEHEQSNPYEAERAMSQLNTLMDRHNLHGLSLESPLNTRFCERVVPIYAEGNFKPLMHLVWPIAKFAGVVAVTAGKDNVAQGSGSSQRIVFFGEPANLEMAVYLAEVLQRACRVDTEAYRASESYRTDRLQGHSAGSLLSAFRQGWRMKLTQRLYGAYWDRQEETEQDPKRNAVALVRDEKLQAAFHKRFPHLGTARTATYKPIKSNNAHGAGSAAADRVNLNRPVGAGGMIRGIGRG